MSKNGISLHKFLPDKDFEQSWKGIKISETVRNRLVNISLLCLSIRDKVSFEAAPLHGFILLSGPPGTGKTTLAKGLANEISRALPPDTTQFIQIDPHGLVSSALGKSQQGATKLFRQTIPEYGIKGACIVLLDEVETLAIDRQQLSLEANPVDVHRATDAVLSGIDLLTQSYKNILIIGTTNFPQAVDEAFKSRADLIQEIPLPGVKARKLILEDSINEFGKNWPEVLQLKNQLSQFAAESDGFDGRMLRKAFIQAAAISKETAKDLNKLSAQAILETFKRLKLDLKRRQNENQKKN